MSEKVKKFLRDHRQEVIFVASSILIWSVAYNMGFKAGAKTPPKHISADFYHNEITGALDFIRINGQLYKLTSKVHLA